MSRRRERVWASRLAIALLFLLLVIPGDIAMASDFDDQPIYEAWVLLGGRTALVLIPLVAIIVWLRGRRKWALVGVFAWVLPVVSNFYPIGNLEDLEGEGTALQDWWLDIFYEFELMAGTVAVLVAIVLVAVAVRVAEPSSWWAQRWYGAEQFRRALERSRG